MGVAWVRVGHLVSFDSGLRIAYSSEVLARLAQTSEHSVNIQNWHSQLGQHYH